MTTIKTFKDIIIARTYNGNVVLITGPENVVKEVSETMDGCIFEGYSGELSNVPTEPGLYKCDVEFDFQQGFFEGYPANSESSCFLIPKNITRIA